MSPQVDLGLDEIDWRILRELQEDARLTYSEIGRRVGLTRPAVAERVSRLEEAGVIAGYRAMLDPHKVGYALSAIIRVTASGEGKSGPLLALLSDRPEVLEVHRVTGAETYFLRVAVGSVEHLEDFLETISHYGQPTTSVILSSPITHRTISSPPAQRREASAARSKLRFTARQLVPGRGPNG